MWSPRPTLLYTLHVFEESAHCQLDQSESVTVVAFRVGAVPRADPALPCAAVMMIHRSNTGDTCLRD